MKKYVQACLSLFCLCCMLFLSQSPVYTAPETSEIIKMAQKMIDEQQYYSAFLFLSQSDPSNSDVDIFLLKSRIALDYSAQSFMHHSFSFANLKPGQTLRDARATAGSVDHFDFRIDKLLENFLEKHPDDPRLNLLKGDMYYDIYLKFRGGWLMSSDEILQKSLSGYQKALEAGEENCRVLCRLGEIRSIKKDYATAERFFIRASGIDENCAEALYNLALLNFSRERYPDAIAPALEAVSSYDNPGKKSEAAFLAAMIYEGMNEPGLSLEYALKADSLTPGNLRYMKGILILLIGKEDFKGALSRAVKIFSEHPDDYNILCEITSLYAGSGHAKEALRLLDEIEKKEPGNRRVLGHVHFARAFYYSEYTGNYRRKRKHLNTAMDYYRGVYHEGHEIFGIIKGELND